jgi:short chain dehydrogenase
MTVVVVTGASAGVGRATARAFAERGAALGLIARDEQRLTTTLREVEADGGRGVIVMVGSAPGESRHPAADHLLRGEARDPRFRRRPSLRAHGRCPGTPERTGASTPRPRPAQPCGGRRSTGLALPPPGCLPRASRPRFERMSGLTEGAPERRQS